VPVGTSPRVMAEIRKGLDARGVTDLRVEVANNPEFLKEGNAIKDFMSPDRVVIGLESDWAKTLLSRLYRPFLIRNFRVIFMDIPSSELTKYASNAMLATRISFMNQLSRLADKLGADIDMIRQGMGSDHRIGSAFLYAGSGYGGSCFPKDVRALAKTGEENGVPMTIIENVHEVNEEQKEIPYRKLVDLLGTEDLKGKRIAVWGLAFKPETDDMREATSIIVIRKLIEAGAEVVACDPIAIETAKRVMPESVHYTKDLYETVKEADALVLLTEWKAFRMPDWKRIKDAMRGDVVIDGRNIYDPEEVKAQGLRYDGIGRR
jgi:UDPglucose 6-dehydrogenase